MAIVALSLRHIAHRRAAAIGLLRAVAPGPDEGVGGPLATHPAEGLKALPAE